MSVQTEQALHEEFYGLQPALRRVELAMGGARDLCYMVLSRVPDAPENETVRHYAEQWLDEHGRDSFREAADRRAKEGA